MDFAFVIFLLLASSAEGGPLNIVVTCSVFGGRILFWAVDRFEKGRCVAMKERKMNAPENIWFYVV